MFPFLATVFFFLVRVESSNYEVFSPPLENRKSLQSNRVMECDMRDVGLNEIQDLIESLAVRKGTTPFSLLRMIQKRMKNKEEMEENKFNIIDRMPEILSPTRIELPSPIRIPPVHNEAVYSLPSQVTDTRDDDVVIIPVAPSQNSVPYRLPPILNALTRNEELGKAGPSVGRTYQVFPDKFPLPPVKNNQFAATVRVNANDNDPLSFLTRDAIITVSPLMTLIEALRQAEIKYQNILGLNHETDVFTFTHSSIMDCYMVNQINGVANNEEHAWQVTISDRDNQVVYNNFCLPSGRDAFVKPGTLISLSYVPV